jgi:hypothetical protein
MSRQPSILSAISFLLVLLLVSSKPAFGQQSASGETLTLEQAISAALRNNRQVKIKELDVGKSEDELAGGRTLRLPKFNLYSLGSQQLTPIDFSFKQGVFGTFPGIGPVS